MNAAYTRRASFASIAGMPIMVAPGSMSVITPVLAAIVDQRPHPTPFAAGDENIANAQGSALNEDGGDRASAACS